MDSQEWDRRYAGTELVWTAEPNRFVVAELQDLAPGRALDVAAGEGRNAVWLVVGHDVTNLTEGTGGPPDPAVLYTLESITRSLSGLSVVRADRVRRPVATADGHREAVDTLVRAIRD